MVISAKIENSSNGHLVTVKTNDNAQKLQVPAKSAGNGSAVNGGEFLLLALATCFCNDIYREAGKRNIAITKVTVEATGEFGAEGQPGFNINYTADINGEATDEELAALLKHTDTVAEIQNTLRSGVAVNFIPR